MLTLTRMTARSSRSLAVLLAAFVGLTILPAQTLQAAPNTSKAESKELRNDEPVKVVYHVSDGIDQATGALRNIRNHLSADPTTKITVVTHSNGIDFLLDGAKDKNGNLFEPNVQELVKMGVDFRVCRITLERRKIDPKRVIEEAKLVPSGVAEVARLQAKEGYVYLRP